MINTKPKLFSLTYFLLFFELAAGGIFFFIVLNILSFFYDDKAADYLRFISFYLPIPLFVCGLFRALVYFVIDYINYRKSAK